MAHVIVKDHLCTLKLELNYFTSDMGFTQNVPLAQEFAGKHHDKHYDKHRTDPRTYDNTREGQGMVDTGRDGNTGMIHQVRAAAVEHAHHQFTASTWSSSCSW